MMGNFRIERVQVLKFNYSRNSSLTNSCIRKWADYAEICDFCDLTDCHLMITMWIYARLLE
jgi:hypothetical protein